MSVVGAPVRNPVHVQALGDRVDHEPRPGRARELDEQPVGVAVFALDDGVLLLAVIPGPEVGGVDALAGEFVEQPVALLGDEFVERRLGASGRRRLPRAKL